MKKLIFPLILGSAYLGIVCVARIAIDSDEPVFTENYVMHNEIYGFNSLALLDHSANGMAVSYYSGRDHICLTDFDFDGKVDEIQFNGEVSSRKEGSRFSRADRKVRELCEVLECGRLISEWDLKYRKY